MLGLFGPIPGQEGDAPHGSTGRLWLMRIGLAALLEPKVIAEDWVWMADHSIQIGRCKCLVILGIRLSVLPVGRPLKLEDMEPIGLVPMIDSTGPAVAECLEEAVARTGVPQAILHDHGTDLHAGVEIFRRRHPETIELYDITHKAACLLKARLEGDQRWKRYTGKLGTTRGAIQQTELAGLTPPSPRTKARFMNLKEVVGWGRKTLALVDDPARLERLGISAERVREKLGWLEESREALGEWSADQEVIEATPNFVRHRGLSLGVGSELRAVLPAASGRADELRERLIEFVTAESSKAAVGDRLPGTTEVLESCFGKLKALEGDQSRSGFTGLVLSLGAMVSRRTAESVTEALERCRVKEVLESLHNNGPSE